MVDLWSLPPLALHCQIVNRYLAAIKGYYAVTAWLGPGPQLCGLDIGTNTEPLASVFRAMKDPGMVVD